MKLILMRTSAQKPRARERYDCKQEISMGYRLLERGCKVEGLRETQSKGRCAYEPSRKFGHGSA